MTPQLSAAMYTGMSYYKIICTLSYWSVLCFFNSIKVVLALVYMKKMVSIV